MTFASVPTGSLPTSMASIARKASSQWHEQSAAMAVGIEVGPSGETVVTADRRAG